MRTSKPGTVFVDLNDVSRKLKPLSRHPVQFVSMKINSLKKTTSQIIVLNQSISQSINQLYVLVFALSIKSHNIQL